MEDRSTDSLTEAPLWQEVEERLGCWHRDERGGWPSQAERGIGSDAPPPHPAPPLLDQHALDELHHRVGS